MKCESRVLWVGIGCQKGVDKHLIQSAILWVCDRYNLSLDAIAGIATLDIKANEPGLVEFCGDRNLPLVTFSAELLNSIEVPNPSELVATKTKSVSIAEAAAICASQSNLVVPKQVFKQLGEKGSVTIAIALS